jgi:murein DD-endopeptidase MepM/ murein hydrolase activator NlpD
LRLCYDLISMKTKAACLFLILFFSFCANAANSPEELKLIKIQKELEKNKIELRKTKKEEQAVLGRLVVINKELSRAKSNLFHTQKKIKTNENQIGALSSELSQTSRNLKDKEDKLKGRVKEVYKSSGLNFIELLFTSGSMSDFLNRLYFFRKVVEHDSQLVEGIRAEVTKAKKKKSLLQSKTNEIKGLAKEIEQKKKDIAVKANQKQKIYKSLQQRRKEYEARVAELEKSSKDLEVLIVKKSGGKKGKAVKSSGVMAWPLKGRITSRYGYRRHPLWGGRDFHTGVDIAAKYGTPIRAADAGEVIFSGWWDGYGKAIVINHGRSTTTVYGHMSRIYRKVGDTVSKGQTVGLVGSTGYSTGPHLHFEVRKKGKPVNPMPFLK